MAVDDVIAAESSSNGAAPSGIPSSAPFGSFTISSVDHNLEQKAPAQEGVHLNFQASLKAVAKQPPLGPLGKLQGTFVGTGFNMIFRPRNKTSDNKFPKPLQLENLPDDNLLELNLTTEQLTFLEPLGEVPNRGLLDQPDIILNGIPYTQIIKDATNTETGRGDLPDNKKQGIHFETGMMMFVPSSTNPQLGDQILRMANIPHGSSIQARGPAAPTLTKEPNIPTVDITPIVANGTNLIAFPSQTVTKDASARLPQNLSKFSSTIDQSVLTDPNTVLRKANKGKTFIDTTSFFFDSALENSDIMNIPFLRGDASKGPNANTIHVVSTFWISTVEHQITVPAWKPGQPALPILTPANTGEKTPLFQVSSAREFASKTIKVRSTQVQYSQTVVLQFGGLNWPHVSVATLVPAAPIKVTI